LHKFEICAECGFHTAQNGSFLPTFWDNFLVSASQEEFIVYYYCYYYHYYYFSPYARYLQLYIREISHVSRVYNIATVL
jgi:hypothetical protein